MSCFGVVTNVCLRAYSDHVSARAVPRTLANGSHHPSHTARRAVVLSLFSLLLATVFIARANATVPRYSVTDLGTLGGTLTIPKGLNKFGHVAGYANKLAGSPYYGYFWNGATLKQACSNTFSDAFGINSFDKMVGSIFVTWKVKGQTYQTYHLGTCQGTTQTDLGAGPPGCIGAEGWAINDAEAMTVISCGGAYVFRNGVYTNIGTFGGTENIPWAINSSSVVVGRATNSGGRYWPYYFDGILHMVPTLPICSGSPTSGEARSINDLGDIVGDWCGDAFLYANGVVTDLGAGVGGEGINNQGQIVGTGSNRAQVYDWQTGLWYDLNSLASPIPQGVVLVEPDGINDGGQILVLGCSGGTACTGAQYSYLLTPLASASTAAPINTNPPEISGLPVLGRSLTATLGSWSGAPSTYSYQWTQCDANGANCTAVVGATASSYVVQATDLGFTIRVRVKATNGYGSSSAQSAPTAPAATLLRFFEPELHYAQNEGYRADSAAEITDGHSDPAGIYSNFLKDATGTTVLAAADRSVEPYPPDLLSLAFLQPDTYPNGVAVNAGDFLDEHNGTEASDAQRMHLNTNYGDVVYGRSVTMPSGDIYLQYWFFYYYNPKQFSIFGIGEHEGDWEMVQYHLNSAFSPAAATYSQHKNGETCDWSRVPKTQTGRPIAYVGEGSHANYFWAGTHDIPWGPFTFHDYTNDLGDKYAPQNLEDVSNPPTWMRWPGIWGASNGEGASPKSPYSHSQWQDPATFESSADTCTTSSGSKLTLRSATGTSGPPSRRAKNQPQGGSAPNVSTPLPPYPRVNVRRSGEKVFVRYCFSSIPRSASRKPWQIITAVDSTRRDRVPPFTLRTNVTLPCGRVVSPLGRAKGHLVLRIAIMTRTGAQTPSRTYRISG